MNIFLSSFGDYSDSSSSSETSSPNRTSSSEVILASAQPKKRAGRRVFKETRHPVYRGVRRRNNNKWVCEMRVPPNNNVNKNNKSRIWLGTYPTPEMAARAHDVAALALKGKSACLNFADSAWRLTLPESNDTVEIRRAAMEAAQLFAVEDKQCCVTVEDGVFMDMEDSKNVLEAQVPVVSSEFEDMHDLILSIANEPLRSNPPSPTNYNGSNYNDMEIFDTQIVSLWNFSI
uniref:ERF031 n=1 Tax=Medicago sativa subsp. falcata TaxID=3878 RepID=A0A9E9JJX5_MEDSF|nr:ERF031 [Medicago sativa subsp. falcata]